MQKYESRLKQLTIRLGLQSAFHLRCIQIGGYARALNISTLGDILSSRHVASFVIKRNSWTTERNKKERKTWTHFTSVNAAAAAAHFLYFIIEKECKWKREEEEIKMIFISFDNERCMSHAHSACLVQIRRSRIT